jgi:hypothetical protein
MLNPILAGIGLFVLPLLLTQFAKTTIPDSTRVGLFSLTPLFAVILLPHLGGDMAVTPKGGFVAAMIAVAGTALLFPIEIPQSLVSFAAFCAVLASAASIAAANCLAVKTCQDAAYPSACFAAISSAAGSLGLGALAMTGLHNSDSVAFDGWVVGDLLALALLFGLMSRMSAVRMTTRFLIAPLLANLAGLAVLRPHVQLQAWLGLLLIGLASVWLLVGHGERPETSGTTLGIN